MRVDHVQGMLFTQAGNFPASFQGIRTGEVMGLMKPVGKVAGVF